MAAQARTCWTTAWGCLELHQAHRCSCDCRPQPAGRPSCASLPLPLPLTAGHALELVGRHPLGGLAGQRRGIALNQPARAAGRKVEQLRVCFHKCLARSPPTTALSHQAGGQRSSATQPQ